MSFKKLLVLFVGTFIVFLVLYTPINIVAKYIAIPNYVALQNLKGTLWSGNAQAIQVDKWQFTNLTWEVKVADLFTGKLSYEIKFGQARNAQQLSGKANISLGFSTLSLSDVVLRAPASSIRSELPIPTSELNGRVILELDNYQVSSVNDPSQTQMMCDELKGELLWTKAEVIFGQPMSLGTITAQLSCNTGAIVAQFDGNNELGLEGDATIVSPESFSFQGYVKPSESLPQDIHKGISMFSQIDMQGRYPIKL